MVGVCSVVQGPLRAHFYVTGPEEQSIGEITAFQKLFLSPGFLVYGSVLIAAALVIIFYFAPRYVER